MSCLILTFLFSFKIEGSVDSDRGSVIDSEEKEEDSKKNDDYVLEKLFKKSGNHCYLAAQQYQTI